SLLSRHFRHPAFASLETKALAKHGIWLSTILLSMRHYPSETKRVMSQFILSLDDSQFDRVMSDLKELPLHEKSETKLWRIFNHLPSEDMKVFWFDYLR